jgi:hypothetical protein
MPGTWTTHHKGTIGGRPVEVKTYSEGGYRVTTTQADNYDGHVGGDDSSVVIIPPSPKGTPINLEGETLDEIRRELASEGFDKKQIEEIVGHFPS